MCKYYIVFQVCKGGIGGTKITLHKIVHNIEDSGISTNAIASEMVTTMKSIFTDLIINHTSDLRSPMAWKSIAYQYIVIEWVTSPYRQDKPGGVSVPWSNRMTSLRHCWQFPKQSWNNCLNIMTNNMHYFDRDATTIDFEKIPNQR